MSKMMLKNLVWIAVPLGLAVGCAQNRPATEAAYEPLPNPALTPTSSEPGSQVYASSDASMNAAPNGASPATWALAQEIQQKLISDPTLAPLGTSVIAQVSGDGTVTLTGNVRTKSEQQRVRDTISTLPGVRSVNDQTKIGRFNGPSTINME
jgi:hypothetical protein